MHNELAYIDIHPYKDKEKNELHMMHLTADYHWDPSLLDFELYDKHWFDAMETLPDLNCHHQFDEHGDYLHTHKIKTNLRKLKQPLQQIRILNRYGMFKNNRKIPIRTTTHAFLETKTMLIIIRQEYKTNIQNGTQLYHLKNSSKDYANEKRRLVHRPQDNI